MYDRVTAIVAFTSDHGESLGEHGRVYWDHAELYPASVHVPLILTWPGAPVRSLRQPVRQIDVGHTLLNLAGIDAAPFGGRDLRWAIDEPAASDARYMLSAHGFSAAISSGRWLLILHLRDHWQLPLATERHAHEVELYDLEDDPDCLENLVDAEFARAKQMRRSLADWLGRARPESMAARRSVASSEIENLRQLGYTSDVEAPAAAWYVPDPDNPWCARFAD